MDSPSLSLSVKTLRSSPEDYSHYIRHQIRGIESPTKNKPPRQAAAELVDPGCMIQLRKFNSPCKAKSDQHDLQCRRMAKTQPSSEKDGQRPQCITSVFGEKRRQGQIAGSPQQACTKNQRKNHSL